MHMVIILISFITLISRFIFRSRTEPETQNKTVTLRSPHQQTNIKQKQFWKIETFLVKEKKYWKVNTHPILDHKNSKLSNRSCIPKP